MTDLSNSKALGKLKEREKELKCLYAVEEILKDQDTPMEYIFGSIMDEIPRGWMHTTVCEVLIIYEGKEYYSEDFKRTKWYQKADFIIDGNYSGEIRVYYTLNVSGSEHPFLPDEQKLLNTIAERISHHIFHKKLRNTVEYLSMKAPPGTGMLSDTSDEHWRWRFDAVIHIAERFDLERFKCQGLYLFGSTKNADAGPGSDIDLIVHFKGDDAQLKELVAWMEGWGLCLSMENYRRTGYKVEGSLIDLHVVTDKDLKEKTAFASMIGRKVDGAKPMKVKNEK